MARIRVFTAERSAAIEAAAIVSGLINNAGRLILSRNDGTTIDAGAVLGTVPAANTGTAGLVALATGAEAIAGTDSSKAITPIALAAVTADRTASNGDVAAGSATTKYVTPASLVSRLATTALAGLVRLATNAEAISGTATDRAITPAALAASAPKGVVYIGKGNGNTSVSGATETAAIRFTSIPLLAGRHYSVTFVYGTVDTDGGAGSTYIAQSAADIRLRLSAAGGTASLTDTQVAFMRTATFGDDSSRDQGGSMLGTFTVPTSGTYSILASLDPANTLGNKHRFLNPNILVVEDKGPAITESASTVLF